MPPPFLIELSRINFEKIIIPLDEIRKTNPQRYEMEQLGGILYMNTEEGEIAGFKDVGYDEFWIRGHIPGRPIMPGVILVEAVAQLCSFYYKRMFENELRGKFVGFSRIEGVKFRESVVPGDKLLMLAKQVELKPRRMIFNAQGVVRNKLAFEAVIIGMAV